MNESKYAFKTEANHILRALRMSRAAKEKAGWSLKVGAGFLAEEIESVSLGSKVIVYNLNFKFKEGHQQTISIRELNLRETIETIKFIEATISDIKCIVCGTLIMEKPKYFMDDCPVHEYCLQQQIGKHREMGT
jgi:hypothetical protein